MNICTECDTLPPPSPGYLLLSDKETYPNELLVWSMIDRTALSRNILGSLSYPYCEKNGIDPHSSTVSWEVTFYEIKPQPLDSIIPDRENLEVSPAQTLNFLGYPPTPKFDWRYRRVRKNHDEIRVADNWLFSGRARDIQGAEDRIRAYADLYLDDFAYVSTKPPEQRQYEPELLPGMHTEYHSTELLQLLRAKIVNPLRDPKVKVVVPDLDTALRKFINLPHVQGYLEVLSEVMWAIPTIDQELVEKALYMVVCGRQRNIVKANALRTEVKKGLIDVIWNH